MHDLIIETIARGGYWGIFALMVIENVFPPIPSEVIMGIGGVLLARGQMDFWPRASSTPPMPMMTSDGIGGKTFSITIRAKMPQ